MKRRELPVSFSGDHDDKDEANPETDHVLNYKKEEKTQHVFPSVVDSFLSL